MGLVRRDGGQVDEPAFNEFVDRTVSPLLPGGFTVLTSSGQYRDPHGRLLREPGRLLIVLHRGDPATERALEQVRTSYRRAFDQESVLRIDTLGCASF